MHNLCGQSDAVNIKLWALSASIVHLLVLALAYCIFWMLRLGFLRINVNYFEMACSLVGTFFIAVETRPVSFALTQVIAAMH